MNQHKQIIVTGGLGYIGSHLSVELIKSGYMVLIIDNFSNSTKQVGNNIKKNLTPQELQRLRIFNCDVNDANFISDIMQIYTNIDTVFHIAALKSVNQSIQKPYEYYRANVCATLNLLECMKQHNIHRLIFAGSASVYGNCLEGNCKSITEKTSLNPTNPYGRSKVMSEQLIEDFCKANTQFKCAVLRYFNPAGASMKYNLGEDTPIPQNVLPIMINKILNNQPFLLFGTNYDTKDGTAVRDYFHIDDLTKAHIQTLNHLETLPQFTVLNIGSGKGTSVKELAHTIKTISGISFQIDMNPQRKGDVATLIANIEQAKKLIYFNPKYSIRDICESAYTYAKSAKSG